MSSVRPSSAPPSAEGGQRKPGLSQFDQVVALAAGLAILVVAVLIWRGDRVGVQVIAVNPAAATTGVSTQSPIRITFSEPLIEPENPSLIIRPAVSGTLTWEGDELIFQPHSPLDSDTEYEVMVAAGLESDSGRRLLEPFQWQFQTGRPRILYLGWEGVGPNQLYLIRPDGRERRVLTGPDQDLVDFSPAPDGLTIAYSALREDGGSDLWLVDQDGNNPRRLLDCPDLACSRPVWSPDGRRLIYERRSFPPGGGAPGPPRLWWLDVASGETVAVFRDSQWLGLGVRFSPDGRWIAYSSALSQEIQAYNLRDGTTQLILSQTGEPPAWGPDGEFLLMTRLALIEDSYGTHIFRVDPETGEAWNLTGSLLVNDSTPAWSPDGNWIAFSRKETMSQDGKQIWLMRADGAGVKPLTQEPGIAFRAPQWSPDGRSLVVEWYEMASPDAQPTIGILEPDTGVLRALASPAAQPTWLP